MEKIGCVLLSTLFLALVACGRGTENTAVTQVAAKVNKEEITIYQVNSALSQVAQINTEVSPSMRADVLERLIDKEVVVAKAVELKLDRNPDVLMAIESAKKDVLARAYLEQLGGSIAPPQKSVAHQFYLEHPELFAQRRIFSLQQVVINKSEKDAISFANELVSAGKSLDNIVSSLKDRNMRFEVRAGVEAAEQLPMELVTQISSMKDGQTAVLNGNDEIVVTHLAASRTESIDESSAIPKILQYLLRKQNIEAAKSEIDRLRASAKIEYFGDFKGKAAANVAPISGRETIATTGEQSPNAVTKIISTEKIDKGVSGLK